MKIVFRVDASLRIGSGHVVRCLTLAARLRLSGAEIQFLCRPLSGHMINFIAQQGYSVTELNAPSSSAAEAPTDDYAAWLQVSVQQDADEVGAVLASASPCDWLVVDHYALDANWEKQMRSLAGRIAVIDDLANRPHDCDLLLDQNYYTDMPQRYQQLVPSGCRTLLGPSYALLRDEFVAQRARVRRRDGRVGNLLVFFGGVDQRNDTGRTLSALEQLERSDIQVTVVIGRSNPHVEELTDYCEQQEHITLLVQTSNMAQLMCEADLAVGAGGTTTWERFCMGLPTLAWAVADNQRELLTDCSRLGALYLPNTAIPDKDCIALHLGALLDNPSLCAHMSEQAFQLVDGRGCERVCRELLGQSLHMRAAQQEDIQCVFDWRNHESVRRVSRTADPIVWADHQAWFERVLNSKDQRLLIAEQAGKPVAVVRFDIQGEKTEISLYLAPDQQGQGLGRSLLTAAEQWLKDNQPEVQWIIAEVLAHNPASRRLFENQGFQLSSSRFKKRVIS